MQEQIKIKVVDEDFLIAFSTVPGIGPKRLKLLIEYFGSAQKAWEASDGEINKIGLPKDVLPLFLFQRKKLNISQYVAEIKQRGIKFLTINSTFYPKRLRNIPDPPNVLYINSRLEENEVSKLLNGRIIGIVGTRKMTSYGAEVTAKLTEGLVAAGFTIVSGMALGVDGMAHQTTINSKGITIAVLGAGVEVVYPPVHAQLYRDIIESGGAIISEVAPEKFVGRGIFPARNRIISGLSEAVLVTEGAIDSGSLITARAALEQGREVFAVPGPINSFVAEGVNYLLKNGAKLVSNVNDILDELGYEKGSQSTVHGSQKIPPKGESVEEQKIIDLLSLEPLSLDEITRKSGLPAATLGASLAVMEVRGIVARCERGFRVALDNTRTISGA